MAFVSGPRQVGKTTLAKGLLQSPHNYFSWDESRFRKDWSKSAVDALAERGPGPVVLDEIHKDRRWKSRLKGLFDQLGANDGLIVTGSARLDLYRKGGDSMMGRFLPYRLHPLSVAESRTLVAPDNIFATQKPVQSVDALMTLGGFPEPYFSGKEGHAKRWSRLRLERLLFEDVRDLKAISDLSGLRTLAELLPSKVGGLLSMNSLREDVGVAYATIRSWVQVFEALYHCFLIRPYTKKVARALTLAPKLYLFDILALPTDALGPRLENLTALHLLKACNFWTDLAYGEFEVRYIRDKEQREVDFIVLKDKKPWFLVECKSGDKEPSAALLHFQAALGGLDAYQLVNIKGYDRVYSQKNVRVLEYGKFLAGLV
jgi:uncharacterized protein